MNAAKMKNTWWRILKWVAYVLAALVLLVLLIVLFFDWNWLRHPIERMVTDNTGRALVIRGNLDVKLRWPLTRVQVSDVSFANPAWSKQPLMFTVKRMEGDISLPQLFKRDFQIPSIRLEQPVVSLEESLDGRKNWLLDRNQKDTKSQVKIGRIMLDNGRLSYADPLHQTDVQARISTQQTTTNQGAAATIMFSATGTYKKMALTAKGTGGTVLALNDETTPYPLNVDIHLADIHLQADGTVTSLTKFSTVNMQVKLSGNSLDQLYTVLGIALPRTPKYSTQGHLLHSDHQWQYDKFSGQIGKSDVSGNIQLARGVKRPLLTGNLSFKLLDLADLGSLVGMSEQNNASKSGKPVARNKRDVLPKLPFRTDRWSSVDADVKIQANRIQRAKELPIENLSTRVQMRDSVLTLDPLQFGIAGGTLGGSITLNGEQNPIESKINIHARRLLLNKLFPTVKLSKTSIGQVNGEFVISGKGDAVSQMLASANGKVALLVDGGEISKLMLEMIGLHIWEILELKVTGDKVIKLNCAVADFDVKQGVLQTKAMVLDTAITTIVGTGDINMAQETLHLDLQPHTKVFSPVALRSPIYIRGKFAKPEVKLDKSKLIMRSAGSIAMGIVNPFLAFIPLIDTGPGKNSQCGKLIHEAKH